MHSGEGSIESAGVADGGGLPLYIKEVGIGAPTGPQPP